MVQTLSSFLNRFGYVVQVEVMLVRASSETARIDSRRLFCLVDYEAPVIQYVLTTFTVLRSYDSIEEVKRE